MGHRDFHCEGLAIRVEATDSPTLEWLTEFFAPSFTPRKDGDCVDQFVRLDLDSDEFARISDRGPQPDGTLIDCFALDRGLVQLPLWNAAGNDERIVFDRQMAAFYCRDRTRRRTRVVASVSAGGTRVGLMRVVRELAMTHLQRFGWVIAHAAAFIVDGRAIIVTGPKRAGKTTLLVHALRSGATHLIANDRVAIRVGPDGSIARGIPTIVSLRVSTTPRFSGLDTRLLNARYDYRFTLEEIRQNGVGPRSAPLEAWSLTPIQFCDLLDARAAVQAPVAAILFPRFSNDQREIVLQEMAKPEAIKALASALFPAHVDGALFVADQAPAVAEHWATARATCEALVASVGIHECQLGRAEDGDGAWLSRVRGWQE